MKGLIVLVPYNGGQEFYPEYGYDDDYYDGDQVDEEDEQEDGLDESSKASSEDRDDEDEDEDDNSNESYESSEAYLPVYVETDDEDLALMAIAYAACVEHLYVAFPADSRAAYEWKERGYPGTLKSPGVELPSTEAKFTIPEPGDCFCCGDMNDYEVYTLESFRQYLEIDKRGFIMNVLEDNEDLWKEFNDWSIRILDYRLIPIESNNLEETGEIETQGEAKKYDKLIGSAMILSNSEYEWLD